MLLGFLFLFLQSIIGYYPVSSSLANRSSATECTREKKNTKPNHRKKNNVQDSNVSLALDTKNKLTYWDRNLLTLFTGQKAVISV